MECNEARPHLVNRGLLQQVASTIQRSTRGLADEMDLESLIAGYGSRRSFNSGLRNIPSTSALPGVRASRHTQTSAREVAYVLQTQRQSEESQPGMHAVLRPSRTHTSFGPCFIRTGMCKVFRRALDHFIVMCMDSIEIVVTSTGIPLHSAVVGVGDKVAHWDAKPSRNPRLVTDESSEQPRNHICPQHRDRNGVA